jgi:outer membrane protein assembly factor BamE (lipoprotein component of BamABCDE complex)
MVNSSCVNNIDKNGFLFDLSDFEVIEKDLSAKDRVYEAMGDPTLISNLGNKETWIYYHQRVNNILFFHPKIEDRKIMVIEFDDNQIVSNLRFYDMKDERKDFIFSSKFTEVEGKKISFFKSLFSNIGQVRAF